MTIRHAIVSDLPALAQIHDSAITETDATCYLTPFTPAERHVWWERHQNPPHPLLVAEDEMGLVLGYASLSPWMPGPVYARTVEASVFLDTDARGQGLGTTLLQTLLQEAQRLCHHIVIARVWAGNAPSLALCQKCGFETVGVQREVGWQNQSWVDCVVLQYIVPLT
jgi:L-amino acid N-acyltransferase YncA